jgi:hypothetical protein
METYMAGIFEGINDLIDQSLGVMHIGKTPHHLHKSSALSLSSKPSSFDAHLLFEKIIARMHKNWSDAHDLNPRSPSDENWRWEKKPDISENNESKEKRCEKEIAKCCGQDWVNQVPTASGLLDGSSEKHCNIDLVHRVAPAEFEFIELKYEGGTPLYAAFEILKYGLLYAFSRRYAEQLGYSGTSKEILSARLVQLRVVAPYAYYGYFPSKPDWLQKETNRGLSCLPLDGYRMDFRFEYMKWSTDGDVCSAVANRKPV